MPGRKSRYRNGLDVPELLLESRIKYLKGK